jgi:Suppressor of fused protein (SUFU)
MDFFFAASFASSRLRGSYRPGRATANESHGMKSDARSFAERLHELLGPHRSIRVVGSEKVGQPPICCFFFDDRSRAGVSIAVTYGLSLSAHAGWGEEKPELVVCVKSLDESWGLAAAAFVERLRGEHSFADGSILMGQMALAEESEMSGFLLGSQRVFGDAGGRVELESRTVCLRGAIPIYECETQFIERIGAAAFLERPADFLDVGREHIWQQHPGTTR